MLPFNQRDLIGSKLFNSVFHTRGSQQKRFCLILYMTLSLTREGSSALLFSFHFDIDISIFRHILFELCRRSYTFAINSDWDTVLTFTHSNDGIHSHTVVSLRQVVFSRAGVVGIDSVSGFNVYSITCPLGQPLVGVDVGKMDANNDDKCHNKCNNSEVGEVGTNQTERYLK